MVTGATDFIRIDEVRSEIDSQFPNPGQDVETEIEVENNGYSHRLIGDSFEFLCKLLLYRKSSEVIKPQYTQRARLPKEMEREVWEGDEASNCRWGLNEIPPTKVSKVDRMRWEDMDQISSRSEWEDMNEARPAYRKRQSAIIWSLDEDLSKLAHQFVKTGMNTERVVRAALVDAGWRPTGSVHSWINRESFEDDLIEEMEYLFELLRSQGWIGAETTFEKPSFGNHLHILRGEGDFIVDDLLVDIKTTQNPSFTNSFWRQLLIYYILADVQRVLYEIDGRTYGKEPFDGRYPDVNRVGIYFARYGKLKTINMEEVIGDKSQYEQLRAWIVDRAIEENQHAQHDYSDIRDALTKPYDYEQQRSLSDF